MTATNLRFFRSISLSLIALAVLVSGAFAQQRSSSASRLQAFDVGASFTYLRSNILPGCNCFSLTGGDLQVGYRLTPHLHVIAEAGATHRGGITPDGYALTQMTYTFGARYLPLHTGRIEPFAEGLFGGAHALGSLSPGNNAIGGTSNAVAFVAGGGMNVKLGGRWSLQPARIDYELTNFHNGQANRQNDLRLSTGLVYSFGR